jgi:hypothetical protein
MKMVKMIETNANPFVIIFSQIWSCHILFLKCGKKMPNSLLRALIIHFCRVLPESNGVIK